MALWEVSLFEFIRVTVILGGAAAWLTGRATANTWSAWWKLVVYVVLLAFALRFIHFSLFEGTFFLPPEDFSTALYYAAVDFVVLMIAAVLGRQVTRSRQMARQYGFLRSSGQRS
jgi:amino acid transporter